MGLSASQARFLQLTARRNDNEYQAQQINQQRTTIADKMQEVSMKYSNGINNRQLCFVTPVGDGSGKDANVTSVRLTYDTITAEYPQGLGYQLVDANGTPVRPNDKKASAIREQALQDLSKARSERYFQVSNGDDNYVDVTGKNFMSTIGNAATIKDANGKTVETEQFAQNVKHMSAAQLHTYCSQMGYSFVANNAEEQSADEQSSVKTFIRTYVDDSKVEAAEQAYKEALAEADAIENESVIYDDRCNEPEYLESQLRAGNWTLLKPTQDLDENGDIKYEEVHYSGVGNISDTLYTDDDASITAEYDAQMDYYQHKDKELELQLQQLETSHNAVQTEIDSVKKVIEKNVEKSFKTFG
ncbi:MAG: hypothetical protein ACI37T_02170 [Candidatus Gastranaerophilaceae bacterium]